MHACERERLRKGACVRTCVSERLKLAQQSVGLCDVEEILREGEKLPSSKRERERKSNEKWDIYIYI